MLLRISHHISKIKVILSFKYRNYFIGEKHVGLCFKCLSHCYLKKIHILFCHYNAIETLTIFAKLTNPFIFSDLLVWSLLTLTDTLNITKVSFHPSLSYMD